jgi:DNA processing protein
MAEDNPSPAPFTPPTTEEDRLSCLRLIRSRRVGPATWRRLMAAHGSAASALDALPAIARQAGEEGYAAFPASAARAEIAAGMAGGAFLIVQGELAYPTALLDLPDPPPVLWALGDIDLLARPAVAMVGARNASALGVRMARRLAADLGSAGLAVVSGLARGIDAAAHAAALETGTVAVMAGGINTVYPAENAALAARIAETGLILTEAPVGLEPQARHFPARNRLISALSRAVLVVEAAPRSGSLITAELALGLGREVMAVPGHPLDARAGGCNALIRDGATLVRSGEDAIEALRAAGLIAPAGSADGLGPPRAAAWVSADDHVVAPTRATQHVAPQAPAGSCPPSPSRADREAAGLDDSTAGVAPPVVLATPSV